MTVSLDNSKAVYQGIKDAGVKFLTALPETWLVYSDEPVSVMASLTLGNGATFVWVKDGQVVGDNSCEDVGCRSDNRVSPDYYVIHCE